MLDCFCYSVSTRFCCGSRNDVLAAIFSTYVYTFSDRADHDSHERDHDVTVDDH